MSASGLPAHLLSRQNRPHAKPRQLAAGRAGRTQRAPRRIGRLGAGHFIGGWWIAAHAGSARHVANAGLCLVGPFELHLSCAQAPGQRLGVVKSASSGYIARSFRITPLVHPKPSCSGYSPPPPLRPLTTLYFSTSLP